MKVLSKKVIKIINNCAGNLINLSTEDREFLIAQINGLYEGFLASVFVDYMWIDAILPEQRNTWAYCCGNILLTHRGW